MEPAAYEDGEQDPSEHIKGGEAVAATRWPTGGYLEAAIGGGLVAAFVFIAYQLLMHSTGDPVTPFRIPASVSLGPQALLRSTSASYVVPVGLLSHLLIGVTWSAVFGLALVLSKSRWAAGGVVTLAMVFGSLVWLVDFYAFAPLLWPWLHSLSSVRQFLGHVFFFGLPLGLWVASQSRA